MGNHIILLRKKKNHFKELVTDQSVLALFLPEWLNKSEKKADTHHNTSEFK